MKNTIIRVSVGFILALVISYLNDLKTDSKLNLDSESVASSNLPNK